MRDRLIVLKFGGSVLRDESRMRIAVHEIYRWKRDGFRVVAVVSALGGRTDELLERCRRNCPLASNASRAAVIATGEQESAALLALHLDRAGVPACALSPGSVALTAEGPTLDAEPRCIEVAPVRRALDRGEVVVFPGFIALDAEGRRAALGRGGSDLTALFLADALGADHCRLVKDVDALYEFDPNAPGPAPRRYIHCSYEDALATDGSIIQHKAVRFARDRRLPFELGAFNATSPTHIGGKPSVLQCATQSDPPLSVVLLGHGAVGAGVAELISQLPRFFELTHIAVRDIRTHESSDLPTELFMTDPLAAAASGADIVIECLGGVDTARLCAIAAIGRGSVFITANKALLAECADELEALAQRPIAGSAAVGGALPVLERCGVYAGGKTSIRAVLNGTANHILNAIADGATFDDALHNAQSLGLAEADPSRDLDGRDALDKLVLIARALKVPITSASAQIEPSEYITHTCGTQLRQVATLSIDGAAHVSLEPVGPEDPLFDLPGESNRVIFQSGDGRVETLTGRGAGRWPTAEAVLADLMAHVRARASAPQLEVVYA